jgi:hypothetical protein
MQWDVKCEVVFLPKHCIVVCRLKAGISDSERASIVRQRLGSQPDNTYITDRFHGNENQNQCSSCGNEYASYRCVQKSETEPLNKCLLDRLIVEYNRPSGRENRTEVRGESRRPEVQDADNSEGFGIQKGLNV